MTKGTPSNIFSVSKAVTSLLCGIAVDEGLIGIYDPVIKYILELASADQAFKDLTIEHHLDMRTGLDFRKIMVGIHSLKLHACIMAKILSV